MTTELNIAYKHLEVDEDIVLRQLMPDDYLDMFTIMDKQREYLGEWLPFIESTKVPADTKRFVDDTVNQKGDRFEYVFTIRYKDQFAGLAGFKATDKQNRRTEIGYWLSQELQGKGIVTKSVERLCRFAFGELNMNRIQIRCAVKNEKSKAIPRRLGFVFEGTERDGELSGNKMFRDIECYSKLKRESEF